MDYKIFLLYLKKTKSTQSFSSNFEYVKRAPKKVKIAIGLYGIAVLLFGICALFVHQRLYILATIIATISGAFFIYFYLAINSYDISNIEKSIRTYEEKRKMIKELLASQNLTEKNQIKQLHNRLSAHLAVHYTKQNRSQKTVVMILQSFIFPFIFVVMTYASNLTEEFNLKFLLSVVILLIALPCVVVGYGIFKLISWMSSMEYGKLETFVGILQDILDYEFVIEDQDIVPC